ncbi:MAG TPA: NifU N-terminal domain-containing protein [Longimicrobiaceae bacterium]|nr:NifU N-terminal domain-containing protein [Longimicrobiaceae bacterium]
MAKPKIAFHPTPNPNAGKFTVGRTLVEGRSGKTFDSPASAAGEPIAARLLEEPGVASVFMVADFVTVTKEPAADWRELAPRIVAALKSVG